jgi:hypothetical protein
MGALGAEVPRPDSEPDAAAVEAAR